LSDAFEAAAQQHREREAYVEGSRRLDFASWYRCSDALARRLVDAGLQPGDVVLLQLATSIDYAIALGGAMLAGAVASGLNLRLGPREVAGIFLRSGARVVIQEDGIPLPEVFSGTRIARSALPDLCAGPGLGASRPRRGLSDPAVIIWTSGTTGLPKGAWFDHRNLKAAIDSAGVMSHPFDRRLSNTPFAHVGYMAKMWEQLAFAMTVVIGEQPWSAQAMLRQLRDEKITVGAAVPTQWAKLLELPALGLEPLPHLRLCVTAAAPVLPEVVEEITRRTGRPLISRYAMTESPSICGTEPCDDPAVLYRSVGRPQKNTEVVIVDPMTLAPLPLGEVGRIRLRGPCVMRGYWQEPELTRESLSDDGWLLSGDMAYLEPAGNVVLVGRSSDMYIRGGYNVYPLEVENVLMEHPGVAQAAVLGQQAPVIGEIGVAFVVPTSADDPPTLEVLRSWCRAHLADYKAPDRMELITQMPLTPMQKVDKLQLRKRLCS
jgi:acyl-CoA synthetase (AMP-forming)/AMP-acid ligase II